VNPLKAFLGRARAFLATRNGKIAAGVGGGAGVVGLALWQRSRNDGDAAPAGIPVQEGGIATGYIDPNAGAMPADWWGTPIPDDYGTPGGGGGAGGTGGDTSTPGTPPAMPTAPSSPIVSYPSGGGGGSPFVAAPPMPAPTAVNVPSVPGANLPAAVADPKDVLKDNLLSINTPPPTPKAAATVGAAIGSMSPGFIAGATVGNVAKQGAAASTVGAAIGNAIKPKPKAPAPKAKAPTPKKPASKTKTKTVTKAKR